MSTSLRHATATALIAAAILLGSIVLFGVLLTARERPKARPSLPRIFAVEVARAEPAGLVERLPVQGTARALQSAVISAQVAGEVVSKPEALRPGALVVEGEELIRLDTRRWVLEVERRRALVAKAENKLQSNEAALRRLDEQEAMQRAERDIAQSDFERALELERTQVFSDRERETRESALKVKETALIDIQRRAETLRLELAADRASVLIARAELGQSEVDVSNAAIRAPFSGTIAEVFVDQGDTVAVGTRLISIVATDAVEVPIQLPASSAGDVTIGARATFALAGRPETPIEGEVARLAPRLNEASRTQEAYVLVRNNATGNQPNLLPGAFVTGTVDARQFGEAIAVPRDWFLDGHCYTVEPTTLLEVWLRDSLRRADKGASRETLLASLEPADKTEMESRPVMVARTLQPEIATYANGMAIIRSGIEPGTLIVATNIGVLYDGAVVEATERPAAVR